MRSKNVAGNRLHVRDNLINLTSAIATTLCLGHVIDIAAYFLLLWCILVSISGLISERKT